jgi:hypothetical protein
MKTLGLICFLILILSTSCETRKEQEDIKQSVNTDELIKENASKVSLKIGIAGTLLKKDGNCMPMIGSTATSCRTYPVSRTILIYDYTTSKDVEGWGPLYNSVNLGFVISCNADKNGFFQVTINPGKYSVFIKESNKFYANSSDGMGGINPFIVKNDSVSIITLVLDYAVY